MKKREGKFIAGLLLALVCAGACTPAALAAGPRTHAEMGERAWDHYLVPLDNVLPGLAALRADKEAMRAFWCGCVFPDTGYDGLFSEAAEAAHWQPFQQVYFEYLRERYPSPWEGELPAERDTRRHIAFFLGILCHGVGDVPWHFDAWGQPSMLTAAKEHDSADHGATEVATECFCHGDFDLHPPLARRYWWPLAEAQEVFRRAGFSVTREQLKQGCRREEKDWRKGNTLGRIAAPYFAHKYPWLRSHYENYCYGGVENGGAYSAQCIAYYFARFHGWRYYQNIQIQGSCFPKDAPFLPCEDVGIASQTPGAAFGGDPALELGGDGPEDRRAALIRFDLGDIARDAPIRQATLWLYFFERRGEQRAPQTIEAFRLNRPWHAGRAAHDPALVIGGEGAAGAEDATWERAAGTPWEVPGAQGVPGDRDPTPVSAVTIAPSEAPGEWLEWDITPLVRAWAADPARNFGIVLNESKDNAGAALLRFCSSDAFKADPGGACGGRQLAWRPILLVK